MSTIRQHSTTFLSLHVIKKRDQIVTKKRLRNFGYLLSLPEKQKILLAIDRQKMANFLQLATESLN